MESDQLVSLLQPCQLANELRLLVQYGSGLPGRDIDLLAVYDTEGTRTECILGRLDVLVLSERRLEALVTRLDPLVTEPVLTGRVLVDEHDQFDSFAQHLREASPTPEVYRHLLTQAHHSYSNSLGYLASEETSLHSHLSVLNLTFAISYLGFAHHYRYHGGPATTLGTLVPSFAPDLSSLWKAAHSLKSQASASFHEVERLLEGFEAYLLR